MEAFYPYTVVPQKVKTIISEKIPLPKLPKLLPSPETVKKSYVSLVILLLSLLSFTLVSVIPILNNVYAVYALFFISLISFVATIFEFVKYGKLKKHYEKELRYYQDRQNAYKMVKQEIDKIETDNKDEKKVQKFRQEKIHQFFRQGYDVMHAVHNKYSPAKKRFKLFLEAYFPDDILDDIKIVHRAKKIIYVPDFVIQFENPKINIAIEIEEPYSLSYVPENIQTYYEAKDRLRQRFANELAWVVVILSEEQAVLHPTQSCKFIEESISEILHDIKSNAKFADVKTIDKQKILSGEERAKLKANKYREIYLTNAGLMDKHTEKSDKKSKNMLNEKKATVKSQEKLSDTSKKSENIKIVNKNIDETKKMEQNLHKTAKKADDKQKENENEKSVSNQPSKQITKDTRKVGSTSVDELIRERKLDIKRKLEIKRNNLKNKVDNKSSKTVKSHERNLSSQLKETEQVSTETLQLKVSKNGGLRYNQNDNIETVTIDVSKNNGTSNNRKSSISTIQSTKIAPTATNNGNKRNMKEKDKKQLMETYRRQLESAVFDKKWNELIIICNKAIENFPNWDWAYYRRSTAYGHKKEFEKVITDCNMAIKLNNNFTEAYYNKATANYFLAKYDDAIKEYDKAILLNYVKIEDAYLNKGLSLLRLNRADEAKKEFLKSERLGSQRAKEILKKLKVKS